MHAAVGTSNGAEGGTDGFGALDRRVQKADGVLCTALYLNFYRK